MLITKQIERKLSLVLACCLSVSALTSCKQIENTESTETQPMLHPLNAALPVISTEQTPQTCHCLTNSSNTDIRMQQYGALIDDYLKKKNLSTDHVAIELYNFKNKEHFALNENKYFTAASTYKLPLAVIYYDMLRKGSVKNDYSIKLKDSEVIEPYGIGACAVGCNINVHDLLNPMIISSDNTAAHVLFDALGGFTHYKELVCENINIAKDPAYIAEGNLICSRILTAFAKKIYENQADYEALLCNMQKAEPVHYLNLLPPMHNVMVQKYGSYAEALNSVGLQLKGPEQYSLVVLTNLGGAGEQILGEISALTYAFFYPDKIDAQEVINQARTFQFLPQPIYVANPQVPNEEISDPDEDVQDEYQTISNVVTETPAYEDIDKHKEIVQNEPEQNSADKQSESTSEDFNSANAETVAADDPTQTNSNIQQDEKVATESVDNAEDSSSVTDSETEN